MPNALQAGVHRRGHPVPPVSRAHAGVAKAGKAGACDPAAVSRPAAALCPAFARLLPRARRGPPPETHSGRFRPQRILLYRLLWRLVKRTAGRRAERRRRETARDRPLCPARARFCRPGPPRSAGGRHPARARGAAAGLAGCAERELFRLSGGAQQRVAIARNRIKPGSIILADEPTGSVDAQNRDVILDLLPMRNGQGKTVVIVAHGPMRQTHVEGGAPAVRLRGRAGRTARREASARFRIRHVRRYGRRPQEKCGKRAPGRTADGKKGPGGVTPPGPVFQPLNRSMRDQYTLRLT